ncbi:MAG: hypothetical protein QOE93_2064, partial [Actinomycetota bacterium]|nr:hypothetical protein [Actinomycetota bacterium]
MYDDEHPTRGDDNDGSGGHP